MTFNVENFNNQYIGDYARQNLFLVNIAGVRASGEVAGGGMFVKAASLPATTVGMVEVPYQNRKLKIPGDRTFADWTATILQDEGYVLRTALLNWQAAISGFSSFSSTAGVSTSHKQILIQPWNRNGTKSGHKANVYGWPMTIAAIDLNWETADKIQEYTVTFAVSWDDGGIDAAPVDVLA